jgi:hypothetical protein
MFSRDRARIVDLSPAGSQRLLRLALLAAGVWYLISAIHEIG